MAALLEVEAIPGRHCLGPAKRRLKVGIPVDRVDDIDHAEDALDKDLAESLDAFGLRQVRFRRDPLVERDDDTHVTPSPEGRSPPRPGARRQMPP